MSGNHKCSCSKKFFDLTQFIYDLDQQVKQDLKPQSVNLYLENSIFTNIKDEKNIENGFEIINNKHQMFIENFKKQFKLCENCFRTKNKVAITILTKLGCDYPNPEAVESLRNLIKLKQFQGILGGRPNQALFIIGLIEDDFLYLDPHRVQQFSKEMESYRQQEILAISESELDSSCGITFLFENLDSIKEFYGEILWMKYEMFNLLFYFNTNGLVKNEIIQLGEEDIKKELMKEKQKEGNKQQRKQNCNKQEQKKKEDSFEILN